MSRLRSGSSRLFAATAGFLAGMAAMALLSILFRSGEIAQTPVSAPTAVSESAPHAGAPEPVTRAPVPEYAPAPTPPASTPPVLDSRPVVTEKTSPPAAVTPSSVTPPDATDGVDELRGRHLDVPVEGINRAELRSTFDDTRTGGRHEALDVLAPRNRAVRAVEDGTIAKLFLSKAGGITVYQFDPESRYAYYYAHLARYADGLTEGATVTRGQVLGYVGTTGNAPPDTPHLHFAIFRLTAAKRWWQGTAIDPFAVLH